MSDYGVAMADRINRQQAKLLGRVDTFRLGQAGLKQEAADLRSPMEKMRDLVTLHSLVPDDGSLWFLRGEEAIAAGFTAVMRDRIYVGPLTYAWICRRCDGLQPVLTPKDATGHLSPKAEIRLYAEARIRVDLKVPLRYEGAEWIPELDVWRVHVGLYEPIEIPTVELVRP